MSAASVTIPVPASVAIGAAQSVSGLRDKAIQLFGTFAATIDLEVSLNGSDFEPMPGGAGLTAPAVISIPFMATSIRANTTAFTSGVPGAVVLGDNPRTS